MSTPQRRGRGCGCLVAPLLAIGVVVAVVVGLGVARQSHLLGSTATDDRCVFTAGGRTVALDAEQARWAALIVGIGRQRGLPARAGSIAVATAMQESKLHNITHGDRDSLGLFQQRPSQGWGTEAQVQDPYWATNRFYDALVKVKNWQSDDINDIAQKVQRSGHPEGYRQHEPDARVVASAVAGHSHDAVTCEQERAAGNPEALADLVATSLTGPSPAPRRDGSTLLWKAGSPDEAWAVAAQAIIDSPRSGARTVSVGDRSWQGSTSELATWEKAADPLPATHVRVEF